MIPRLQMIGMASKKAKAFTIHRCISRFKNGSIVFAFHRSYVAYQALFYGIETS